MSGAWGDDRGEHILRMEDELHRLKVEHAEVTNHHQMHQQMQSMASSMRNSRSSPQLMPDARMSMGSPLLDPRPDRSDYRGGTHPDLRLGSPLLDPRMATSSSHLMGPPARHPSFGRGPQLPPIEQALHSMIPRHGLPHTDVHQGHVDALHQTIAHQQEMLNTMQRQHQMMHETIQSQHDMLKVKHSNLQSPQAVQQASAGEQAAQNAGKQASTIHPVVPKWQKSASERQPSGTSGGGAGWPMGDRSKWKFDARAGYEISLAASNKVNPIEVDTKEEAVKMVQDQPNKFFGCMWVQAGYVGKAKVFPRTCVFYQSGFLQNTRQADAMGAMMAVYSMLPRNVSIDPDQYTDKILSRYQGNSMTARSPGRGQGVLDRPGVKIVKDINPGDVDQGGVGDCWLLSAISALAEFDKAIQTLFKKKTDLHMPPSDDFNKYTIALYDLRTWQQVDVVVDERLIWSDKRNGLLGCNPGTQADLWPCLLEKAVAAHCGGWEKIDGGQCTHAWRLLTGCKEVYTIRCDAGKFGCFGTFNPNSQQWEQMANSPHEGFKGLWPMKWPEVGGGGHMQQTFGQDEVFAKMCAWDTANYIMCAGTKSGTDTEMSHGIVDGHAYSILTCLKNAGGAGFDMIKMRNPWGKQEFELGGWKDNGPNWQRYPAVYEACGKPVARDDGIFWMQKENFFKFYQTVYLCAQDMAHFVTRPKSAHHGVHPPSKAKQHTLKSAAQDLSKWEFDARDGYEMCLSTTNKVDPILVDTKEEAIKMVKDAPQTFFGCMWLQEGYVGKAKVYPKTCSFYEDGFAANKGQPDATGAMKATYVALPRHVTVNPDAFTDGCLARYQGKSYPSRSPGRAQGVLDKPGLKVVGQINPADIDQGGVGNCWLLSAIAALAEFDDAIATLFKKRGDLHLPPSDGFNKYTIQLYDLKAWQPVDVVIDERLIWSDQRGGLLGCTSTQGDLWPMLLEKAVAAHCGGWDKIDGGQCTHAWLLLTGCKEVYTIKGDSGRYSCFGAFNPNSQHWEQMANSPHDGFKGLWPMKWPDVGGGGGMDDKYSQDETFARMAAWDAANFIMGAGTHSGSDTEMTDGIVDGHAYSILACIKNAGGSGFDMVKMRNPWGKQEFDSGGWKDGGVNWKRHPEVYEACGKPVAKDDGIFWMAKENFFTYFATIYLAAHDMAQWTA